MVDDRKLSPGIEAPPHNSDWELVSSTAHAAQPSAEEPPLAGAEEFVHVNYFTVSSDDPSARDRSVQQQPLLGADGIRTDESSSLAPELDWIEPSSPFRSCVLLTDEDDDSASRSHSEESREGTDRQSPGASVMTVTSAPASDANLAVIFHGESSAEGFATISGEVSRVNAEDSSRQAGEVAGDEASSSNESGDDGTGRRWSCHFLAWLAEAGRTNTLWPIVLAAAVVGVILLGSGWQRFRLKFKKLRCRFFSKGKEISQLMYYLIQIKESSSNSRRIPILKAQAAVHVLNNV